MTAPDKRTGPSGGGGPVREPATGLAADPTPGWRLALLGRRRASRELTEMCGRLDGGTIVLPGTGARCTSWCRSMPADEVLAAVEIRGSCRCAAKAVAP